MTFEVPRYLAAFYFLEAQFTPPPHLTDTYIPPHYRKGNLLKKLNKMKLVDYQRYQQIDSKPSLWELETAIKVFHLRYFAKAQT